MKTINKRKYAFACLIVDFAFKARYKYLQKQSCGLEEAGLLLDSVAEEVSQRLQRVV